MKKKKTGKLSWSPTLQFWECIESVARIFHKSEYGPTDWIKNDPEDYIDALFRHLSAFIKGEAFDEGSGEHHLAHVVCNCFIYMAHTGGFSGRKKKDRQGEGSRDNRPAVRHGVSLDSSSPSYQTGMLVRSKKLPIDWQAPATARVAKQGDSK